MQLELNTLRIRGNEIQFFVEGGGDRTDDMITFDGHVFRSNGGSVDWDEIDNADEASTAARAAIARAGGRG